MKRKEVLYIIIPPIIQSFIYFITKLLIHNPHVLTSYIDSKIPFIPYLVYFYIIWYLLLIIGPYLIYRYDKELLKKYDVLFFICSIICGIIFIIYPTTVLRPTIEVNGASTFIVNLIYYFDSPALNCFPSLHALNSLMWIIFIGGNKKMPKIVRCIVTIISIGVIVSTLCIKQHIIYDLLGSIGVLIIGYIILKITKK